MPVGELNWLAVGAAVVANMVVGALWYSPILFGNMWLEATGRKADEIEGANTAMATAILPAILFSLGLALVTSWTGAATFAAGASIAIFAWACFVVPTLWLEVIFNQKPYKVFYINIGYFLVSFALMGAILGGWR